MEAINSTIQGKSTLLPSEILNHFPVHTTWELGFVQQMDFSLIANVTWEKVFVRSGGLDCGICSAVRGLELQSCRQSDQSSATSPLKGEKIEFSMMELAVCTFSTHVTG